MEINFKGSRQSEYSPGKQCIPGEVFCSASASSRVPWRRECSVCLSADTLPGDWGPFAQWCVQDTLEDTQFIFNYHTLCCHRETKTGRVTRALQFRNLNFEPALFTYPSSLCYSDKLHFSDCSCTAGMRTQSCLTGISAFKRL